ncbi:hypothetical protein COR50_20580 [Chitinophaga caeni]|uniref:RHS repeat-associated core domain-containing protein n=1 Tax=Chitinophaga caeni TaxID=2029983 RepID=A0A291QZK4_9BACT|nr:hypothetical protein [Chitinophaga caeni]ATL49380.1 hypothetical protein COR50_20580 [Chitinophaga caeni]
MLFYVRYAHPLGIKRHYEEDIDNQSSANNYNYDKIGNIVSDIAGKITNIDWTVYGKIKRIAKQDGSSLEYAYDVVGNRIFKKYTEAGGTVHNTWYVRDASGNTLAVYGNTASDPSGVYWQEQHLYGSSRLGLFRPGVKLGSGGTVSTSWNTLGNKQFELTNHLGNVLAVISNKKLARGSGSTVDYYDAELLSAMDYYPFGMQMPGRVFNGGGYRFGFQTQEKVNEVAGIGNHYTATFWEYDPRTARRWNLDPKGIVSISDYAAFKDNPIIYTDPLGDFNTKFGAWLYQKTHSTGGTLQKNDGEWFINRNSSDENGVVVRPGVYDWNGSSQAYKGSGWGHQARSMVASMFGVNGKSDNIFSVGLNSILQSGSTELTGGLLDKVKQDPAIVDFENSIVERLKGKEAGTYNFSQGVQLGGKRGSLNPFSKNSAATWKVAGNPLTWVVRSVNVQAAVELNAEGGMHITYKFVDNLDLRPEKGGKVYFGGGNRPWQYNAASSVLGVPYHDVVGGNDKMKVKATWTSDR